jgi:hypothetical protein
MALCIAYAWLAPGAQAGANELVGWAVLAADTYADGPSSGQFAGAGAGGHALPQLNRQPVQGFSAVLPGPAAGSFRVMGDNGFGAYGNSGDTLLRIYTVRPDFRSASGGSGSVSAADWNTGARRAAFDEASRITLRDPLRKLGFKIQADYTHYYDHPANPRVDASIRGARLLTGADLDIESVRRDKDGNLWFGDEFGPYLVKTDAGGKVLQPEVWLPGVFAPQHGAVRSGAASSNLGESRGFEGMAINPAGDRLYTLLEGSVGSDVPRSLRINAFDIDTQQFARQSWLYRLEANGTSIGDMSAINEHEFLVIERNGATASGGGTPFKKVYRIDLRQVDAAGLLLKSEVVDLMNIADPNDLDGDGSTTFTFPYVTVEGLLLLDATTLLIINDNNFPGVGGRNVKSDPTEFLKIRLSRPLR